jgi:quercetin dioxygenase-like cupin family protein
VPSLESLGYVRSNNVFNPNRESRPVEMMPGVVRRTLSCGDRTLLCEISLAKGSIVPPHQHLHEQIGYVVKGRLVFKIGDEERELAAGDGYVAPGNVSHSVTAVEESIAIDIFSPVREEYLNPK